jgi:hypothetical protein
VEPPQVIRQTLDRSAPTATEHSMQILEYLLAGLAVVAAFLLGLVH